MSYVVLTKHNSTFLFSICTLVTDFSQYGQMRQSFAAKGFSTQDCEFLCVDNSSGNQLDAYSAINLFLHQARGRYIILCHQDILLHADGREDLLARIEEIEEIDPQWALLGNAGAMDPRHLVLRISDPHADNVSRGGPFPKRVVSLDENFIIVRGSAKIGVSVDIGGFHLYGADICLQADIQGHTAYVIDFHLRHLSGGSVGSVKDRNQGSFFATRRRFINKYDRALCGRWIPTTCTCFYISGSRFFRYLFNRKVFIRLRRKSVFFR